MEGLVCVSVKYLNLALDIPTVTNIHIVMEIITDIVTILQVRFKSKFGKNFNFL